MEELVSIIVPVYNVEKYLERCVNSILDQTYKNIEIILVDDGSEDKSPEICDSFSKKHSTVRVIHQENKGLSATRNIGIQTAQGKWISMVDSDDYISVSFISELVKLCLDNDCDCAVCDYVWTNKNQCEFTHSKEIKIISGYEAVIAQFGKKSDILTLAWNKIYKRSLFEGVNYPTGRINEDFFTTHELLYHSKKVVINDSKLYAYYQSPEGIMRQGFSLKKLDILEAYRYRISYYTSLSEKEIVNITRRAYCNRLYYAYWICKHFLPDEKEVHNNLKILAQKEYAVVRRLHSYPDSNKIKYILMRIKLFLGRYFPKIYKMIFVHGRKYI